MDKLIENMYAFYVKPSNKLYVWNSECTQLISLSVGDTLGETVARGLWTYDMEQMEKDGKIYPYVTTIRMFFNGLDEDYMETDLTDDDIIIYKTKEEFIKNFR